MVSGGRSWVVLSNKYVDTVDSEVPEQTLVCGYSFFLNYQFKIFFKNSGLERTFWNLELTPGQWKHFSPYSSSMLFITMEGNILVILLVTVRESIVQKYLILGLFCSVKSTCIADINLESMFKTIQVTEVLGTGTSNFSWYSSCYFFSIICIKIKP